MPFRVVTYNVLATAYLGKGGGRPDGCATFYRSAQFSLVKSGRLGYSDQEKGVGQHSGFIALLTIFTHAGRTLGIANTHLRWDPYTAPKEKQVGYRQAEE